ncbi:MAG: hypothetical protein HYU65_04340 [Armatimonadetes bacterium]|nr:hypothetical protein [Armatimonadota bacterium]
MLHRMDAAGQIETAAPYLIVEPLRDRKPQRRGLQPLLREIERFLAEDLVTEEPLAREGRAKAMTCVVTSTSPKYAVVGPHGRCLSASRISRSVVERGCV